MFYLTGIFLGVLSVTRLRATSPSDGDSTVWLLLSLEASGIYATTFIEKGSFFRAVKAHQLLLLI